MGSIGTHTRNFSTQGNKARLSYLLIVYTGQAQLLKNALRYPPKSIQLLFK